MLVTPELKQRINDKLKLVIARVEQKYNITVPFPTVVYALRGTTAGTANYATWTVDLNAGLLLQNVDEFIERTVPHEMAHLACHKIYPESHIREYIGGGRFSKRSPHGPKWQEIMRVMGVSDITRTHSYDVSTVKQVKATSRINPWACPCGKQFMLSTKMSNQLRTNPSARFHCRGRTLVELVASAPVAATPVAQKPVYAIAAQVADKRVTEAPGSKIEKCANLYVSYQHLGRATVIAMFINEADCTPAGASTYYATLKKRYE